MIFYYGEEDIIMLNNFENMSNAELSTINGGGKADYNFGYNMGRGLRKWYKKHF